MKKMLITVLAGLLIGALMCPMALAQDVKIGYVDLRRCFYEYEKKKVFDKEIEGFATKRRDEREAIVEQITKLQGELELASDKLKSQKQRELDAKIAEVNQLDSETRQELLNKQNEMFQEVIDDIQKIVDNIGKTEDYEYILDSRNVVYATDKYDLTDRVLKELNK